MQELSLSYPAYVRSGVRSIYACLRKGNVFTCERSPSGPRRCSGIQRGVIWDGKRKMQKWQDLEAWMEQTRWNLKNGELTSSFSFGDDLMLVKKTGCCFPPTESAKWIVSWTSGIGKNSAKIFGVLWMPWTWWSRINFPTGTLLFNAPNVPLTNFQNTRSQLCGHPKSHVVLATTKQVPRAYQSLDPIEIHLILVKPTWEGGRKVGVGQATNMINTWNHSSCGADSQSVKVATFRNYHNQCEW